MEIIKFKKQKVTCTLHACWKKDKELKEIQLNQSNLLHEDMKVNKLMPMQKGVMNIFRSSSRFYCQNMDIVVNSLFQNCSASVSENLFQLKFTSLVQDLSDYKFNECC